jgi:hypothetical protein
LLQGVQLLYMEQQQRVLIVVAATVWQSFVVGGAVVLSHLCSA